MWVEIDEVLFEITGAPKGESPIKNMWDGIALGRAQTPDDLAALVFFLGNMMIPTILLTKLS